MQGTASERDLQTLPCLCSGTSSSSWSHHCNIHQPHQHCSVLTSPVDTAEVPPEPRAPRVAPVPSLPRSLPAVGASAELLFSVLCPTFWIAAVILRLLLDPKDPLHIHSVSVPSCCIRVQTAELGFAGTARCIFQFIFLHLFPVTHFSSFPQGWCVLGSPCLVCVHSLTC